MSSYDVRQRATQYTAHTLRPIDDLEQAELNRALDRFKATVARVERARATLVGEPGVAEAAGRLMADVGESVFRNSRFLRRLREYATSLGFTLRVETFDGGIWAMAEADIEGVGKCSMPYYLQVSAPVAAELDDDL